jgi:hypothetical protein
MHLWQWLLTAREVQGWQLECRALDVTRVTQSGRPVRSRSRSRSQPVLDAEIFDPFELALVVGHDRASERDSVGGDE